MIKLETQKPKVWAKYKDGRLTTGSKVYLPDTADLDDWQEFDSVEDAKDYFGIVDELSNAEMLMGLNIQPNVKEV